MPRTMPRMTVAKRLALGFGVCLVLQVLAVGLALNRLAALDAKVSSLADVNWPKVLTANRMALQMNDNARATFELLLGGDEAALGQRIETNKAAISQQLEQLDKEIDTAEGKQALADIRARRKTYVGSFSEVDQMRRGGDAAGAIAKMNRETTPALAALLASVDQLVTLQNKSVEAAAADSHATYRMAMYGLVVFVALTLVLMIGAAVWIIRSVTRPLGGEPDDVAVVARRIAEGDLSGDVVAREGDTESRVAAMKGMQESIRGMVIDLQANAEQVSSAAKQLAVAAQQVASGTEAQSEAASSVAAAVEEMTVSIGEVSGNTDSAHDVTLSVGTISAEGSRVIQDTATEIRGIAETVMRASQTIFDMGENANKITGVVDVIREIAEQTNLLALNASIEAARAGEQGRGFAVVADEVKKLAERTAHATAEIHGMIDGMQQVAHQAVNEIRQASQRVHQGVELAQQADRAMNDIAGGTEKVIVSVQEISSAIREQTIAANQIAGNVERIAQMAEENSAAAGQAAATAGELESLAAKARAAVSRFRLQAA